MIVPPETDSDMATVPDIEPDVEPPPDEAGGGLTPSDSAILQSLLTAARAEAEREREEECFERLGEARQFVARQQE